MTAVTARPAAQPQPPAPERPPGRPFGIAIQLFAGLAVVASGPALAGVIQGRLWLISAGLAVALVVGIGLLVRSTGRRPWWVIVAAQSFALLVLVTILFGQGAPLGVIPLPATIGGLIDQLGTLGGQIDTAVPPLPPTGPLLLLVCLVFGVFGIIVDALTAAGYGPAACGLVLLCAYTVSTTLTREALPNWSLVTGAAGFAVLLLADQRRRQGYRSAEAVTDQDPDTDPDRSPGKARAARGRSHTLGLGITACAVSVALLVGTLATAVGTQGRFPGNAADQANQDLQFGLNPFTSIRNQLAKPEPVDLLRVRGLPPSTYLRALTLSEYVPSQGWQLPRRRADAVLDSTLPSGLPTPPAVPSATVEIDNLGYRDRWLPLAGLPLGVTGVVPGRWRYDVSNATAYASEAVMEPHWVERAAVLSPRAEALNALPSTTDVDPMFLSTAGVDPRISRLSATVTARARTPFAKAAALNQYFLNPANGFRYSLTTAPGNSGDALVDFLERGKTGYCEQFASAMAVMLRTVGVPARVAIGFTPGKEAGGVRTIGTRDAHAWVEGFFPGYGWLTLDPTPLGDGRAVLPGYLSGMPNVPLVTPPDDPQTPEGEDPNDPAAGPEDTASPEPSDAQNPDSGPDSGTEEPGAGAEEPGGGAEEPGGGPDAGSTDPEPAPAEGQSTSLRTAVLVGLLIALGVVALVASPSTVRRVLRHRRTTIAGRGGPTGAAAAWREVLAESIDRGDRPPGNRTVRSAARNLAITHGLDASSSHAVRAVVDAVERGWYAPPTKNVTGVELVEALKESAAGLNRAAPLRPVDRLWPRSVRPGVARRLKPGAVPPLDRSGGRESGSRHARAGAPHG